MLPSSAAEGCKDNYYLSCNRLKYNNIANLSNNSIRVPYIISSKYLLANGCRNDNNYKKDYSQIYR